MMKRPSFINFFLVVLSMRDSLLLLFSYFEFNSHSSGKVEPAEKRKERRGLKKKSNTFFLKYCHRVVRVGLEKRKETTRAISSVFSLPHAPGARALTTRACENGMVVDRQIRFFFPQDGPFFGVFFVYGSALSFRNAMTTKVLLRLFCFVLVQ